MSTRAGKVLAVLAGVAWAWGVSAADLDDGKPQVLPTDAPIPATFNESGGERQVLRFDDLSAQQGMSPMSGYGGFAVNRSFIRGFANDSALRNGYRDFGYLGSESDAASDGAEVFKGPASALYGNGKPGGDINLLTRQPDGVRRRDVRLQLSRFGHAQIKADFSTAIQALPSGAFRFGMVASGGQDYRQFDGDTLYGLAPSVAWKLGPRTRIQLEADFIHIHDQNQPRRLPLREIEAFPGSKTLGERTDHVKLDGQTVRGSLEHLLNDSWRWRQSVFLQRGRDKGQNAELDVYGLTGPTVITSDGRYARRVVERSDRYTGSEVVQTELYGRVGDGKEKMSHELLLGLELGRYKADTSGQRAPLAALDLQAPQYGAMPGVFEQVTDQAFGYRTRVLYAQDRMTLSSRWRAMLGLRLQNVDGWSRNRLDATGNEGSDTSLSPRAGIVYQAATDLSVYASLTHATMPQLGASTAGGGLLPPEESRQMELGLQWGHAENGLLSTLSIYQLRKRNLATTDLQNPRFSVAAGEQESQGVELAVRGVLGDGLNLDASMEVMLAEVRQDNDVAPGTALPGVAPWFVSTWLTWEWSHPWTVGLGIVGEGRRQASWPPNSWTLPTYWTWDASISCRGNGWRAQFSISNMLGQRVVESNGYSLGFVTPYAASMSVSFSF